MNVILFSMIAGAAILVLAIIDSSSSGSSIATVSPLARAIATAEGFYAPSSNIPQTANNPGDLTFGGDLEGVANTAGVNLFSSVEVGFSALENALANWFSGNGTQNYSPNMSLQQFANTYVNGPAGGQTQGSINWMNNVITSLAGQGISVNPESAMSDVFAQAG